MNKAQSENVLKVMLLAAAADGITDEYENEFLDFVLSTNSIFLNMSSEARDKALDEMLQQTLDKPEDKILESLVSSMDKKTKIFVYAMALEVCYCNQKFISDEENFMETLARVSGLTKKELIPFHKSANIRYTFGDS